MGWAAAALALLPGAWVSAFLPRGSIPWGVRFSLAVALSPLLVLPQFYLARLGGLSFAATARVLAWVNLPPLVLLLLRLRREPPRLPRGLAWEGWVLLLFLVGLLPRLLDPLDRALSGHAWMHADICYRLAAGDLIPEEPALAGVRLAYFWAGHVYAALVFFLADACPASAYIWLNLLFLAAAAVPVAAAVRALGLGREARAAALALLFFGLNAAGYWVQLPLPRAVAADLPGLGDPRYTPWLMKVPFFSQLPLALAALAAQVYLHCSPRKGSLLLETLCLLAVLLVYPLLFPAAAALSGCAALRRLRAARRAAVRRLLLLGLLALAGWGYVRWVTAARSEGEIFLAAGTDFLRKGADLFVSLLVLAPLAWQGRRPPHGPLLAAAALSGAAYLFLHLPYWRNEYKFLFPLALFLVPAAAGGASARLAGPRGRWVFFAGTLLLAVPWVHKNYAYPRWGRAANLTLDLTHFSLRLAPAHPLAAPCEAIRTATPPATVLVVRRTQLHLPALTGRVLYAPPLEPHFPPPHPGRPPFHRGPPGLNLDYDYLLLRVRGYRKETVAARRRVVAALFAGGAAREAALATLQRLGRPVLIACGAADRPLAEALARHRAVRELPTRGPWRLFLLGRGAPGRAKRP